VKCTTLFENGDDIGTLKRSFELFNAEGKRLYRFNYENTDEKFYIFQILDSTGDMIVVRNENECYRVDKNGPVSLFNAPQGSICFNKDQDVVAIEVEGGGIILFWDFKANTKTSVRCEVDDRIAFFLNDGTLLVSNGNGKKYGKISRSGLKTPLPIFGGVWCGDVEDGFALFNRIKGEVTVYDLDGLVRRRFEIKDPKSVYDLAVEKNGEWVAYSLSPLLPKPYTDIQIVAKEGNCLLRIEKDINAHLPWIDSVNGEIQFHDDAYALSGYIRKN